MANGDKTIKIQGVNPVILLGSNDSHLRILQKNFNSKIIVRGDTVHLKGDKTEVEQIEEVFTELIFLSHKKHQLDSVDVETVIRLVKLGNDEEISEKKQENLHPHKNLNSVVLFTHRDYVEVKSEGQAEYVKQAKQNDIVFAIGPAGTGKTYLAVAIALASLKNKEVERIVISRPAVETGESLGFLPGDLRDKIDPYLRPLYDALHDMIPSSKLRTYMEQGAIEIVPLAYMRGRTLNNAYVILDEAQNTTPTQMKMFLTRLGANSKAIVTGDVTQSDLPRNITSGLREVEDILMGIEGIAFVFFNKKDVVRHRLVREIIEAYDTYDDTQSVSPGKNLSLQRGGD
ncbi:PhoH family protein [bacterium]|nr:PhoH family protein [bacterium]